jgi:hypothetical protein
VWRPERTQGPLSYRLREGKGIPPLKVDMAMDQGRQPGDIGRRHVESPLLSLLQRRLHRERIPQDNRIDDQAQRPQLIFLSLTVPLPEFAPLPVKDCAGDAMAGFAPIELGEHPPPLVLIINIGQHGEAPRNPPQRANGPCQGRGAFTPQEGAHEFRGPHRALLEGARHPE